MSTKPAEKLIARFAPGDVICREGEPGDEMFVVQKGRVRLTRRAGDDVSEVGTLGKGDFFGEMCLLEGLPRAETADALEATEVLRVNGLVFNKMVTTNAEIAVRMLRKISLRLRESNEKLIAMLAGGRVAAPAADSGAGPGSEPAAGHAQPAAGLQEAPFPAPPRPAPPPPAAAPLAAAPAVAAPPAGLIVQKSGQRYAVKAPLTLIGRHDPVTGVHPEIDLSAEELGKSVSRRHAKIEFRDGQYFLTEEIGTLNTTSVNGVKLETGVMTPLLDGDEIGLGAVKLTFRMGAA